MGFSVGHKFPTTNTSGLKWTFLHCCWWTHNTEVQTQQTQTQKKVWGAILERNGLCLSCPTQLKRWQHVHISLPQCKQQVGCRGSHANTCPDHTLGCIYQRANRSNANIQPWLHSQVKQGRRVVADSWENWKPYVIYTSYINIFQRWKVGALFIWLKYEWHASIANHLKKNIQLVTADACVLFHLKQTERM